MSESTPKIFPTSTTTTTTTVPPTIKPITTGPVTREQQRKADGERDAADEKEPTITTSNDKKVNKDTSFKGTFEKLSGHVFQMADERRKPHQFTLTMEALRDYAFIELDHAHDLAPLFTTPCENIVLTPPTNKPPIDGDTQRHATRDTFLYKAWTISIETYYKRKVALDENMLHLFTVILLQCSKLVKNKLEVDPAYAEAKLKYDCKWLIDTIKGVCHRFEQSENRFAALCTAKLNLFSCRQNSSQSVIDYYNTFHELLSILESYGGKLHDPIAACPPGTDFDKLNLFNDDEIDLWMRERYCAMLFLQNSDNHRFGSLKLALSNDFIKNQDEFPTSLVGAQKLLLSYQGDVKSSTPPNNSSPVGGRPGRNRHGRHGGHGGGGRTPQQVSFCLAQIENHFPLGIPSTFVLLDSDSTVSIFCNPDLLIDIHDVDTPLYLETNGGGSQVSTQMGTVPNFGPVWYNPLSIANVLSLAHVRCTRRVTMDFAQQPAFHVHHPDGTGTTIFHEHESGLYLLDSAASQPDNTSNNTIIAHSCLQTVAHNKSQFINRQIESADAARSLYRFLGRPSLPHFLSAIQHNHINNCPVTVDDVLRAESIYGKDVAFIKGKTTARPATAHIPDFCPIDLPSDILSQHRKVTICFDLFYVLGLGFSLSTSRNIRFLSCHHVPDRSRAHLSRCIASDLSLYRSRGFDPVAIHADGEYNSLQTSFPGTHFTICSADGHIPEIERAIRTVKETIRATIHGIPFPRLPRVLVKELATHAVRSINMFPSRDGISTSLSPCSIVTGQPKPDYRTFKLEFGTYVQVYDGTSNDTKSRTLGAIATNPTGNSSGDYFFMSLQTGQRIHR